VETGSIFYVEFAASMLLKLVLLNDLVFGKTNGVRKSVGKKFNFDVLREVTFAFLFVFVLGTTILKIVV
jgi:hypothetical protein